MAYNKKRNIDITPELLGDQIFTDVFHRSLEITAIVCELAEEAGYPSIDLLPVERLSEFCETAEVALRGLKRLEEKRDFLPTVRQ